jgi:transcription elongation factor Elf1
MECPNCGCCDLRAVKTVQLKHAVRRIRVCRHCGRRMTSVEQLHVPIETYMRFGRTDDERQEAALAVLQGRDPQKTVDSYVRREKTTRRRERAAGLDPYAGIPT